jgi:hypothetical protein
MFHPHSFTVRTVQFVMIIFFSGFGHCSKTYLNFFPMRRGERGAPVMRYWRSEGRGHETECTSQTVSDQIISTGHFGSACMKARP